MTHHSAGEKQYMLDSLPVTNNSKRSMELNPLRSPLLIKGELPVPSPPEAFTDLPSIRVALTTFLA